MESTKVMLRDKVSAGLGGNLLTLDGSQAHILSLNLARRSLGDDEVTAMANSLVSELRRRHGEVRALRSSTNVTLQVRVVSLRKESVHRRAGVGATGQQHHR